VDPRVIEFHCIMPIANVPSVVQHGILSYERAAKLAHHSVAMQQVQDKRDQKHVPGGQKLHQYANLYFHARNPMMYRRQGEVDRLCVLRIAPQVLGRQGAVITDRNAASEYVRFLAPSQWTLLAWDDIFAMDWRHPDDQIAEWRHKSRKCAEVLIPHQVEPKYLVGAYVVDQAAAQRLTNVGFALPIAVEPVLFFR
jgi:hypothetical protein